MQQGLDIKILINHLNTSQVFHFEDDKSLEHTVVGLYHTGLTYLSGIKGSHAKHLQHHKLCLHGFDNATLPGDPVVTPTLNDSHLDLGERMGYEIQFTIDDEENDFGEIAIENDEDIVA